MRDMSNHGSESLPSHCERECLSKGNVKTPTPVNRQAQGIPHHVVNKPSIAPNARAPPIKNN